MDALYFTLITLSTVGFGDFVPRSDPPDKQAIHVKNKTKCFEKLINPMPSVMSETESGLTQYSDCNPSKWPFESEMYFTAYRIGILCWILIGMVWLGGVISMIVNFFACSDEKCKADNVSTYHPTKSFKQTISNNSTPKMKSNLNKVCKCFLTNDDHVTKF